MKIPLEWLNEYVNIQKTPREIGESFTLLGLMLEKVTKNDEQEAILDLEHRMDRSDWLSILGCARDLAAFEQLEINYPPRHTQKGHKPTEESKIKIEVQCEDLVNRFNTRVFKGVKVGESPEWLKKRLEAYGIASKNNIVDITNYVMIEYGQPMHAQDTDKMEAKEIVIRRARHGEEIVTLLGETVKLDENTFVLTQAGKPSVIGGVVGGKETAVDEKTVNIVLDAGNYNQTNVRRTSRRLKIQNETVLRYDKFLHPHLTQVAIERATHLILELAGGEYYENEDWYPEEWGLKEMTLRLDRIKQISGMEFGIEKVKEILIALEYTTIEENTHENSLKLKVPYFRTDIEVEDDLAADILRIHGYNKIPQRPINSAPPKEITPKIVRFEEKLRDELVKIGLHEHITDPLVAYNDNERELVMLQNALSSEKNALRISMYETLKPVVDIYKKHRKKEAGLFEIGKTYKLAGDGSDIADYSETRETVIIYTHIEKSFEDNNKYLRGLLSGLLKNLGIVNVKYELSDKSEAIVFQENLEIAKIKNDHIILNNVNLLASKKEITYIKQQIPNVIAEDVSLILDSETAFGPIYSMIEKFDKSISSIAVLEEFTDTNKFGDSKKAVLVRIEFDGNQVTTNNVETVKEKLLNKLSSDFGVTVRDSH